MATTDRQPTLDSFRAGTTSETVTETVILPLQTSQRKNEVVKTAVDEFQAMCSYMADMLPSFSPHQRNPQNPSLYRLITREFPKDERDVAAKVALAASRHVLAAFESRRQRGDGGERPTFGDGSYFMIDNQQLSIVKNDAGFGLKANFIPYKPQWYHINTRPYTREYLDRIVDGDASFGTAEFHLDPDGDLRIHLPVSWDVEVYKPGDVSRYVGVDIGENVIFAAAVLGADGEVDVDMQSGREFRHYRERLKTKRSELMENDDLRGVKATRQQQERYTEQVLDTASRSVVELAVEHSPCCIRLEDLVHYRQTARDPIHDWPFAMLQEKIAYKARAEGIPVETVNPENTSTTCRKCGQTNPEYRSGSQFSCTRCGYEVHADVNAAINIAQSQRDD